ncbi:pentapeptide repeat-containing protein [Streptomyces syringium]|uniref:Uncharacterized protein YjbI with pentapeptide repeats n=1 Tax=Streptomyces syringium TaxID=76729 RepID=A0ABS4Y5F0_9ACTN|nr:pentapeptide repeat-containing protein [Streptomyces syringium]MBP2404005.1 uncharacterized protein YjbI with pentapeptide repeats [Streptomyces syringium]
MVQLLAVLGAGIALIFTAFNYRLTRRGQVTDRFIKALERLDSEELYVRLGGVLALEQIVQDAPDQATHAAQVLSAFLRRRAPGQTPTAPASARRDRIAAARRSALRGTEPPPRLPSPSPSSPEADVQHALTALTHPSIRKNVAPEQELVLDELNLAGVKLTGANLSYIWLNKANLSNAWLSRANLSGAWLSKTILTGAWLVHTDLTHARLDGANLSGARLTDATLTGVILDGANLTGAWLEEADLTAACLRKADLTAAHLEDATLIRTRLEKADLTAAHLEEANLTQAHLDEANLTRARLDSADFNGADLTAARLDGAYLGGADLSNALGLTPTQVWKAVITSSTRLPDVMAGHPLITARVREIEHRFDL